MRIMKDIEKRAFNVELDPSSLVGAITGATAGGLMTKKKVQKQMSHQFLQDQQATNIGRNYYEQVENIEQNLKIIFTPFNVVYVLKNGNKQLTLDTIDTEEMDDTMYTHYVNKDYMFFKNILLNKIKSEVQISEQMFARKMLERQMALQGQVGNINNRSFFKRAEEIEFGELVDNVIFLKEASEENKINNFVDYIVKTAGFDNIEIETNLDGIRPLDKYAGLLSGITSFFGFDINKNNLKEFQGNMDEPGFLNRNLIVGFLPDRVLFIVDNKVITQLNVIDMNEAGFEAFNVGNKEFFRKMFSDELKKKSKNIGKPMTNEFITEKKASYQGVNQIFSLSDIHPKIYYDELTKTFGNKDWFEYDPEVIVKDIEEEYGLEEGIFDIPLNKIWCLQLINNSSTPYESNLVFEKCVRAINSRPIDFESMENNFKLDEIVFGLEVMQDLTEEDDIFVMLSEAVKGYIADTLIKNNVRVAFPSYIIDTKEEQDFYISLNEIMLEKINDIACDGMVDDDEINGVKSENKIIMDITKSIIDLLKDKGLGYSVEDIVGMVNKLSVNLNLENHVKNIIIRNVMNNMEANAYLGQKESELREQKALLEE